MASADLKEKLKCSICTDIYTDPVTLMCGHNYCQACITRTWDNQEEKEYSCPECRHRFKVRPELKRNLRLRNIAESFRTSRSEQEGTGIPCTYCVQSPVPTVKTCLLCDASLCANHLRVHSKSAEHVLTDPTTSLENRKCSIHKKVLEYYCCEDAVCICVSCRLDGEHRGHQVETLNEASVKKKEKLRNILLKLTSKREAERMGKNVPESSRIINMKSGHLYTQIIGIRTQLKALEKQVLSEISRQEQQVPHRVSSLIRQLEIKKEEMSRKMGDIKELCDMSNPVTVLQGGRESVSIDYFYSEQYDKVHTIGDLDMGLISMTLHTGLTDIMMITRHLPNIAQTSDLLLDINTACNHLTLSNDLKTVSYSKERKCYTNRPERFSDKYSSVLSTRSFSSGCHYWEVEVSESADWAVTMAYPSIARKAVDDQIKCWGVVKFKREDAAEDCKVFYLPDSISCKRLGIFLDYEAGRLSFYDLSDPIRHLHTFTAAFTEPLLFLFTVFGKGWLRIRS